jgi:hypothetical protein
MVLGLTYIEQSLKMKEVDYGKNILRIDGMFSGFGCGNRLFVIDEQRRPDGFR